MPNDKKIAINKMQGEIDDMVAQIKNVDPPKFQSQSGYTYPGGQNYREAVFVLDEAIPRNIKVVEEEILIMTEKNMKTHLHIYVGTHVQHLMARKLF